MTISNGRSGSTLAAKWGHCKHVGFSTSISSFHWILRAHSLWVFFSEFITNNHWISGYLQNLLSPCKALLTKKIQTWTWSICCCWDYDHPTVSHCTSNFDKLRTSNMDMGSKSLPPLNMSIFIKMLDTPKELTQVICFYPPPTALNIYCKSVGPNPFIAHVWQRFPLLQVIAAFQSQLGMLRNHECTLHPQWTFPARSFLAF